MAVGNDVTIVGNVTRDPELRFTANGVAVCDFGLAWNRRWPDRDGEWQEEAHFFDVTVWDQAAENVAESFSKGDRVVVVGRLQFSSWEDKESGDKRSKVSLVADEVGATTRWATVKIARNEKDDDKGRGSRGGGRSGGGREGGNRDGGSREGGGSRGGGRSGGRDNRGYDDEPF